MAEELAAVIDEIRAAKPVPFSTSAMVNRKDLVERLEEVRDNIPLEIKRAAGVVADRQDVLAQSREEAEAIIRRARIGRNEMPARTEVVRTASAAGSTAPTRSPSPFSCANGRSACFLTYRRFRGAPAIIAWRLMVMAGLVFDVTELVSRPDATLRIHRSVSVPGLSGPLGSIE